MFDSAGMQGHGVIRGTGLGRATLRSPGRCLFTLTKECPLSSEVRVVGPGPAGGGVPRGVRPGLIRVAALRLVLGPCPSVPRPAREGEPAGPRPRPGRAPTRAAGGVRSVRLGARLTRASLDIYTAFF